MLVTTTQAVPGHRIKEIIGPVAGYSASGTTFLRDFFSNFTDFFGGRSGAFDAALNDGIESAHQKLVENAKAAGADAVVGFRVDTTAIPNSRLLTFLAVGTAVKLEPQ